jgi:hypothetical protein
MGWLKLSWYLFIEINSDGAAYEQETPEGIRVNSKEQSGNEGSPT